MICCNPSFVIPVRRFLNVSSQKCHFFRTRPFVVYKFNSCTSFLESWFRLPNRNILSSAAYHIDHTGNEGSYCKNYQIRYNSNEANEGKEPEKKLEEPKKKLSQFQKLKKMFKEYWYVLVPVHLVTSSIWFGSFYYIAKNNVDINGLLQMLNLSETLGEKLQKANGPVAHFTLASAMYKLVSPFRYAVTLGITTLSIKYLRDWGYIKPIPTTNKIREIIVEKKDILRDRGENLKGFYKDKIKNSDKS